MKNFTVQTFTGKSLDYLNPQPDQICIEDIAKALSQECRFASQSKIFYSVAQHSMMVAGFAPLELKLEALLHDAEEAYIKDLPTPLQAAIGRGMVNQYKIIKKKIKIAIRDKFQLKTNTKNETVEYIIKQIDLKMAVTEVNFLFKNPKPLYNDNENITPYDINFIPMQMQDAEIKFKEMFKTYQLYRELKGV